MIAGMNLGFNEVVAQLHLRIRKQKLNAFRKLLNIIHVMSTIIDTKSGRRSVVSRVSGNVNKSKTRNCKTLKTATANQNHKFGNKTR